MCTIDSSLSQATQEVEIVLVRDILVLSESVTACGGGVGRGGGSVTTDSSWKVPRVLSFPLCRLYLVVVFSFPLLSLLSSPLTHLFENPPS